MELFYIFYTPFPEMLMCTYTRNTYVKTLGTVTKENPFNNLALGNKTDDIVNHFHLPKVYEWKFQVHIMSGSCSNERQWFFLVKLGQLILCGIKYCIISQILGCHNISGKNCQGKAISFISCWQSCWQCIITDS